MKFATSLFVLSAFAFLFIHVEAGSLASFASACKKQENASDKDIEDLEAGKLPSSQESKCLVACLGKQYGIIKDNKLSKSGIQSAAKMMGKDDKKAGEIADACLDKTDSDRCEAAFVIWNCMAEEADKKGFKVL